MHQFLKKFNGHGAASTAEIEVCERWCGSRLPQGYLQFLSIANGGEGFIGRSYAILWPVNELPKMNDAYEVSAYAPGLLIFGSDGGGEAYGFDVRSDAWTILKMPFVGMSWDLACTLGGSFQEFLQQLESE
jgi:hypothetical protein